MILNTKGKIEMKLSEFIKKYGDCEITDKIKECIVKKPKTVWDLKIGDICYGINIFNEAVDFEWCDSPANECTRSIGLITLTEEELKFKIESMKVYEELKRFAKEFTDEEWENCNLPKHYIIFDYEDHAIKIGYLCYLKGNDIYFESEEKAREAIKWVGEDRVKKYYLGVKE